ncbi:MAG TPA: PqqD family peptide modification chaperone [Chloroflexia bacterium]|nr:PqqD family peptide modification chaperone [Chloroflexia bacterium]
MKAPNYRRTIEGGIVRQLSDPYKGVYYAPLGVYMERDDLHLVIDPEAPHWLSTNEVGAQILRLCDGRRNVTEVAEEIARRWDLPLDEAIADTFDFLGDASQVEFVSRKPNLKPQYPGRAATVAPSRLSELYVFVTNDCNLRCTHCYVSSGDLVPENEMTTDDLYRLIDEARDLGVQRFYFTGGEPFMRRDIFDLIEYVCSESELVILTNATFFNKSKLARLTEVARAINGDAADNFDRPLRLNLQISVDGPDAELHEMVRGPRTFNRTIQGIRDLVSIGLTPVVSTVITTHNMDRMAETTRMLGGLGVKEHHILWLQERGRAYDNNDLLIPPARVTRIMRELREVASELGMVIDNETSLRVRVRGKAMRKTDLCNCGYESLDVFSDGQVYPCVWFSGAPSLACGSVRERSLRDIWLNSPILQEIRANSVQHREGCNECHLKFICGGGTNCSSYFDSLATRGKGSFQAAEPYCETFMDLTHDLLWEQASQGVKSIPRGYSSPVIYNAMERQGAACAKPNMAVLDSAFEVGSFHCACVLQADVADGMKVRSAARVAAMQAGDLSLIPTSTPTSAPSAPSQSLDLLSASVVRSTGGRSRQRRMSGIPDAGAAPNGHGAAPGPHGSGHHPDATRPAPGPGGTQNGLAPGSQIQEDAVLDGMGLPTTELLLMIARQMRALRRGETIKVVNDDPAAREDLREWCRMTGNELAAVARGKGYASYYVRRTT